MATDIDKYIFISILLLFSTQPHAKIVSDDLTTDKTWIFLNRFCFLSKEGTFDYDIQYPKQYDVGDNSAQNIFLYYDDQWPSVYAENPSNEVAQSCAEKESVLLKENNQVINLTDRFVYSGCSVETRAQQEWYVCKGTRTFTSSRERWWFIVLSNCASDKGMYAKYTIKMTNDREENVFFYHFSADEFYILQISIGFLIAYGILIFVSAYIAYSLQLRQMYHMTYKIYLGSICLEFAALIVQIIYWSDYAVTGRPKQEWKNFGRFLEFSSQMIFLILLILFGKGYTVTRARISNGGVIKLIGLSIFFIVATITMYIWEIVSFDPGLVLYIYDSVPGYVLIGLKIASWLWFLYAIFFTLKHYPEKATFYVPLVVVYTLWFWTGAGVALAAIDLISRWAREKIVQGCILTVTFIGHLVFMILTWPTLANKSFPFHIKTTQISVMTQQASNQSNGANGQPSGVFVPSDNSLLQYEPIGERQFIDMFTTDRTRSGNHTAAVNPDRFPHA